MEVKSLFEVPRNSYIAIVQEDPTRPPGDNIKLGPVLFFHHIDGMYSLCHVSDGTPCHIAAWTDVVVVERPDDWET